MQSGLLRFSERTEQDDLTKALLDHLPHGALVTTPRGRVVYANEAYHRIIGIPEKAGTPTIERFFSGNPRIAEQLFRLARAARQGNAWEEEFSYAGKDDAERADEPTRWFRISVRQIPVRPGKGFRSARTLWLIDDVSGERRKEDNAFESLQQMVDYLDHAPAGFLSVGSSGNITYMNATLARWVGYDLSDVADGKVSLDDIIIAGSDALTAKSRSKGKPAEKKELETDLVRRDGTSFAARILYRPVAQGDGNGDYAHMIVLDCGTEGAIDSDARALRARFSRIFMPLQSQSQLLTGTASWERRIRRLRACCRVPAPNSKQVAPRL